MFILKAMQGRDENCTLKYLKMKVFKKVKWEADCTKKLLQHEINMITELNVTIYVELWEECIYSGQNHINKNNGPAWDIRLERKVFKLKLNVILLREKFNDMNGIQTTRRDICKKRTTVVKTVKTNWRILA